MTTENKKLSTEENLTEIGKSAYSAIADMVAALNCDYERLEELRDQAKELEELLAEAEGEEDETAIAEATKAKTDWYDLYSDELDELEEAAQDCRNEDEAREAIMNDALTVEVRSGWTDAYDDLQAEEFKILISTGGPAVQIRGDLDEHKEPRRAWLEVQDWGTPWTQYFATDHETLLTYARCFYYGE